MEATKHCRSSASIFDVSHMLGSSIRGKDAVAFTQRLVVGDIAGLKPGTGTLSVVTNEQGGIIDDTVVTKVTDEDIYIVLNGACSEKDQAHINKHLAEWKAKGKDVDFVVHGDRSLLAFQGPKAVDVLQPLTDLDLSKLYFGMFTETTIAGKPVWLTRTGYTGEDGFEISLLKSDTVHLTKTLLENPAARMCGLGARDSLRLEAGLCLYGNDLDETISPLEAGLTWTIGKSRRDACDFVGGDAIKKQLAEGVAQARRAQVHGQGRARARREQDLHPRGRGGRPRHQRRVLARARREHRHGVRRQGEGQGGHGAPRGDARKRTPGRHRQDALRHLPLPQARVEWRPKRRKRGGSTTRGGIERIDERGRERRERKSEASRRIRRRRKRTFEDFFENC